jgi:hypothetical protein
MAQLQAKLADATCFESDDLTTNNPRTTPVDNAIAPLPFFAFTPQFDRAVISPDRSHRSPITRSVPGLQIDGRIAGDPAGATRILLRLPDQWNGKLVVAGSSGTRSEFNGDFAWSDYVLQRGYAYVSQNKGVLNFSVASIDSGPPPASDPLACRLNPTSRIWVHFYANDAATPFTRWTEVMIEAARIGRSALAARYGRAPARTYAVGTSNGGYQVRRALEAAPELFDGGIDSEGTFVDSAENLLAFLPAAVRDYPAYAASGFDADSPAALRLRAAGFPPDIVRGKDSLWGLYWTQFWEVTECQWQKELDPGYDTYGAGTASYDYTARRTAAALDKSVGVIATTGAIGRPLITVAGTMDALLPIDHQARAYARRVETAHSSSDSSAPPAYRLYEVQNGNHFSSYKDTFPELEFVEPHEERAFDLLVDFVEQGKPLPPDQCIPRGGKITTTPAPLQLGHCKNLFEP